MEHSAKLRGSGAFRIRRMRVIREDMRAQYVEETFPLRCGQGLACNNSIWPGKFAKGWVKEYQSGYKKYHALMKKGEKHPIEKVGGRLRSLMPWMKRHSVKGVQAAY